MPRHITAPHPPHADAVAPVAKRRMLARLKRIEGQVRGLHRMVEEERYCADVLIQLSAVQESLRGVAKLLLRNHLEHCATNALRSTKPGRAEAMYEELTALFCRHAR